MELNIGANIKRFRLAKGFTQEQLAELLQISTAAVSKWEAKNTYPDITLLFPLARIFGVSVDTLLGYDVMKEQADVDQILAEHRRLHLDGRYPEARETIVEARRQFPHDYGIMNAYMWDMAGGEVGTDAAKLLAHREELLRICECILDGSKEDGLRARAIHMKAKLLHAAGNTQEALAVLSEQSNQTASMMKEQLFDRNTEEFRHWNRKNCYGLMDAMAIRLARTLRFDPACSLTEKTVRLEAMAKAFGELRKREDFASFCIAEIAVCEVLAGMLGVEANMEDAVEDLIRVRERQFAAMEDLMALAKEDAVIKELIMSTYGTEDLAGWLWNRLAHSPHPQFAKPREMPIYREKLLSRRMSSHP
ncbi:MAG: helix-turn-helix transcriptional regulator [Clostridia bacterium]|nr:helix-turn-helix transcriptional regulator [Clostridia bacterium]